MTGQPALSSGFAIVMLAMSACCVARLALGWRADRPVDRPEDAANGLMGIAMAGMLLPPLRVLGPGAWQIVFLVAAAVFLGRVAAGQAAGRRTGHDLPHVVACGAMLYMLAAHRGGAMQPPVSALLLAVALLACVVHTADRISLSPAGGPGGALALVVGSRLALCCEIAMGLTMS